MHRTASAVPKLTNEELHRRLTAFNRERLRPGGSEMPWRDGLREEIDHRIVEGEFVERERESVREDAKRVPRDPDAFVEWFESLKETGQGQGDPLFPWLAESAPPGAIRWFLEQEAAGEAGFEDLVALTQVKLPTRAKLELARNYWDEMGRGDERGMHGPMLSRLTTTLELDTSTERIVWESLALGNLMTAFGVNRRYAYQSAGALGVIELTAPGRAAAVNRGLKRIGVSGEIRKYFALHATLDVKHSEAWNREVLRPLVAQNSELAVPIAEGALLRLRAGARCFERYRRELWQLGAVA
ncbi:MAG TPA: iron-containing redox enzyme family protein [Polyangiaceae bacterium]